MLIAFETLEVVVEECILGLDGKVRLLLTNARYQSFINLKVFNTP